MSDGLDYIPSAEDIWPPPPTLPPPSSRIAIKPIPIWVPILTSISEGFIGIAEEYLRERMTRPNHFVDWHQVYFSGEIMLVLLLPTNFWLRSMHFKRKLKERAEMTLP